MIIAFQSEKASSELAGCSPEALRCDTVDSADLRYLLWSLIAIYCKVYIPLNLIPVYIGIKYLGKRFTFYSFYVIVLSSVMTDLIPKIAITYDVLLICIFGGIINGAAVSICLFCRCQRRWYRFHIDLLLRETRYRYVELYFYGKYMHSHHCRCFYSALTERCIRLFSSSVRHN